jgi:cytochrome c oxidase cbb3-type subunit 4
MDVITMRSLFTVGCLVLFLGIVAWTFSRGKKSEFEEAGRLPLSED